VREIRTDDITSAVASLCIESCYHLGNDILDAIRQARNSEESPLGREVLDRILENASIAASEEIPLCQDTGITLVFLELGQDVHIIGGDLYQAVEEGVRQGYAQGYLRKSVVKQPFSARINTKDNTPPIIYTNVVSGDQLKIVVLPKGSGSENMTRLAMLKPSEGRQGIVKFVVKAVEDAGSNPCPPIVVCVGIGGTSDKAAALAKKAMLRKVGQPNPDTEVAELERELLKRVNALGIGPQGFGGGTTALAVHIEVFPTHVAMLPVVVNLQCHSARHKEITL
jgi:fumarate hydratase subunit alpha